MFCEECGTKNKEGSAFCEKCGHKFEQVKTTVQKEKKPMSTKSKIITGVVVGVVALLTAAYFIIGSTLKPEKIALKYFKAYANRDANAIYDTLQLEESKFVSKDLLEDSMKNEEKIELENYSVKETSKEGAIAEVTISYIEKDSTKEREKTIRLAKSNKKQWLVFDKWIVDTSDMVAKDFTVSAPKGSTVKVGGIKVPDKYKSDSYGDVQYYKIPKIIKGKYSITAELKNGLELQGEAKISGNYDSFSSSKLSIAKESKKNIEKETKEIVEVMYQAMIEKKDFSEIKDKFDEEYRTQFEEEYNRIKGYIMTDYTKLKEFKLSDLEVKSTSLYNGDLSVTLSMKYDYKVAHKVGDKEEVKEKKDVTDTFYAYYKLDGKKLVLKELSSLVSYFSYY